MKTLLEQYQSIKEQTVPDLLEDIITNLGIDERGGGPEGLYYTHPDCDGEYLWRSLPLLILALTKNKNITTNIKLSV